MLLIHVWQMTNHLAVVSYWVIFKQCNIILVAVKTSQLQELIIRVEALKKYVLLAW
jgi:hypothetical protein